MAPRGSTKLYSRVFRTYLGHVRGVFWTCPGRVWGVFMAFWGGVRCILYIKNCDAAPRLCLVYYVCARIIFCGNIFTETLLSSVLVAPRSTSTSESTSRRNIGARRRNTTHTYTYSRRNYLWKKTGYVTFAGRLRINQSFGLD